MNTSNFKKLTLLTLLGLMFATFGVQSTAWASNPTESPSKPVTIPVIPKPDLMPGPSETADQETVQNYFRNQAIPTFITGFLGLIAGAALLALMWAGIRFMTAYGEEEAITAAKKTATWAVIGFGISLLAYAIVGIINTLAFPKESDEGAPEQETVIYEEF